MSNLQFCKYKLLKSTYYISGHGLITITAKSKFGTNGLWRRAFYVRRSLKGLRKPFERIFQRKWNVIWTLFWTFFEMDKSCLPVAELALSGKKTLTLWTKYLLYLVFAVIISMGLPRYGQFHQHFLQNSFEHVAASDMIVIDILRATSELFFNMDALNCTKATWKAFHTCSYMWFPIKTVAKKWSWKNYLHVLIFPNSSTSEVARPPDLTGGASYNGLDMLGPCMDLSVHVPNGYITVIFNWLLSWKQIIRFPMDPNTVYVLES